MNLIPESATARPYIRLPFRAFTNLIMDFIDECLSGLKGVSYHVIQEYTPTWTSPLRDRVHYTLIAAKKIVSLEATVNMRVGASDARLHRQRGIPTVVVGLTLYNMGGPDEYCLVEELGQVAEVHRLAALEFLRRKE